MIETKNAHKERVYLRNKKGKLKKFGKVRSWVFHPDKPQVVGVVIKRPDLLLMIKRKERFVAVDRLHDIEEGLLVEDSPDSWDKAACKRLGVDFDRCILWDYMPVKTESGDELGTISNIMIDEKTFRVSQIDISSGSMNRALLGASLIDSADVEGYRDGAIVVSDSVGAVEEAGGIAANAGEAWAKAKYNASETGKKAGEKAGKAINEGAYKTGEAIGNVRAQLDKRAEEHEAKKEREQETGELSGVDKAANMLGKQIGNVGSMFKGFKDEFDKASHD